MAHWGIAMTLFTPLWPTRPTPAELATGWEEAQRAQSLAPPTKREQLFVAATLAFFEEPTSKDYWPRVERWETAMKAVHDAEPDDIEASAFYALSLLATGKPGPSMLEHSQNAIALLLPIYQHHPHHPGAMHYIIHANDVPGREHENLDVLHRYEEIAPDNPHALHMPTHIYTRLGEWDSVIRGNLRAAEASLHYPAGEHGEYVWDEYAHAIEYLVYAYLQEGADDKAATQVQRLLSTKNIQPSAKTAFHLASTRARFTLERHAWKEAAAIVPREPAIVAWDDYPWPEAVMWFARGYGSLRQGDPSEAARAVERLGGLEAHAAAQGEDVFTRQIQMLSLLLQGWSAHVAKDDAKAVQLIQQAVDLEGTTPKPPVTPASTLPAPEILGDLYLELGKPSEAAAAYRLSLQRFPHRFNSSLGLARALAAQHDAAASQAYCDVVALGANGTRAMTLDDVQRACHR
jgi:tetratricopeptide (TPR) repeat protein